MTHNGKDTANSLYENSMYTTQQQDPLQVYIIIASVHNGDKTSIKNIKQTFSDRVSTYILVFVKHFNGICKYANKYLNYSVNRHYATAYSLYNIRY